MLAAGFDSLAGLLVMACGELAKEMAFGEQHPVAGGWRAAADGWIDVQVSSVGVVRPGLKLEFQISTKKNREKFGRYSYSEQILSHVRFRFGREVPDSVPWRVIC